MTDTFDSRALRHTDCYGQRFMRAGTYRYNVVHAAWASTCDEYPHAVEVLATAARESTMEQHTVRVNIDGKDFRAEQETVTIAEGDLVVWHCPDAKRSPFAVVGEKQFLGNAMLVNECGFSHAFAVAGEYHWGDALGSDIRGVVRVTDPATGGADDFRRWQQQLTEATLVMITDGTAEPAEVDIVTGQTVYFAVVKGSGISITDARAIHMHPYPTSPAGAQPSATAPPKRKAQQRSVEKALTRRQRKP